MRRITQRAPSTGQALKPSGAATAPAAERRSGGTTTLSVDSGSFSAKRDVDADLLRLQQLRSGTTHRREEAEILAIFRDATTSDLNALIDRLPAQALRELMNEMDDRWFGPDNRKAFVALLTRARVAELGVEARARVISALQRGRSGKTDEVGIRDVFLATKGRELTALKNAVDAGGDYRDLQQLVFHDIDDPTLRAELLAHFSEQAVGATGQVKVLSDIDDTFYANLRDERFPKKTVYPGVRQLYRELDRGGAAVAQTEGDLMMLSARPYDGAGLIESKTLELLKSHGVSASVMSGDWAHLVGNEQIAQKKLENWKQSRQLFPEYGSVFIGDSGQGDAIFGALAMAANNQMKAVFIHDVIAMPPQRRAEYAARGVTVFDTYVGAATAAYAQGLISRDGLLRVADAAQQELAEVKFDSAAQQQARQSELLRDLEAMQAALA